MNSGNAFGSFERSRGCEIFSQLRKNSRSFECVRKSGSIRWSCSTICSRLASLPGGGSFEERPVGQRIPQARTKFARQCRTRRRSRRRASRYKNRGDLSTSNTTRFTDDSRIGIFRKLPVDVQPLLIGGERPAKRPLGKPRSRTCGAWLRSRATSAFAPASCCKVRRHIAGYFDRAFGRRFVPGFRDRRAALVANAAVVGRESRLRRRTSSGDAFRRKAATWNDFDRVVWPLPRQRDERLGSRLVRVVVLLVVDALIGFGEFELDGSRRGRRAGGSTRDARHRRPTLPRRR